MEFRNFLLSSLATGDAAALVPALKEVSLSRGQVLFEEDEPVETIYFPGSSCISVVSMMSDGKAVETATIGRESAVALLDAVTGKPARSRIFTQIAGGAMALSAAAFRTRLAESPALVRLTLLHARANAAQAELGVGCNLTHSAEGRMSRWLLMTADRTGSEAFPLTQDYIAVMTGVQRSTVSKLAAALKRDRVIDYSRGALAIRDRAALMERACDCYASIEEQFALLQSERR
jgi:CRP-like cAMP-binding protein